jgi:hypothetical protein
VDNFYFSIAFAGIPSKSISSVVEILSGRPSIKHLALVHHIPAISEAIKPGSF